MSRESSARPAETGSRERRWRVVCRHSPFLLKVWQGSAASAEQARQAFLEAVKREHEQRAASCRLDVVGQDQARRIREAYEVGIGQLQAGLLSLQVEPLEEVERRQQESEQSRRQLLEAPPPLGPGVVQR
jgi:hypothetical protein